LRQLRVARSLRLNRDVPMPLKIEKILDERRTIVRPIGRVRAEDLLEATVDPVINQRRKTNHIHETGRNGKNIQSSRSRIGG
jgi:hypothetical protein